jgi:hypothetical protein
VSHGLPHAGDGHGSAGQNFSQHLGLALTAGYVLLSFVGLSYEVWLLHWLRSSYISFAEPEDFLMAGMRHPIVALFTLASGGLLWGFLAGSKWLRARWPWYAKVSKRYETEQWNRAGRFVIYPIFVLVYFTLFTELYSASEAIHIRHGHARPVRIAFATASAPSGATLDGVLAASTSEYLFVYSPRDTAMRIIPVKNVAMILSARKVRGEWVFPSAASPGP